MGGLKIKVTPVDDNLEVSLSGALDESAEKVFASVDPSKMKKHVLVNCRGLESINSLGARQLVTWIGALNHYTTFEYEACPTILAEMISLLPTSLMADKVTSLEVPYLCGQCHKEELPLFRVEELPESLELGPLVCPHCQGTMTPSFETTEHLAFLHLNRP